MFYLGFGKEEALIIHGECWCANGNRIEICAARDLFRILCQFLSVNGPPALKKILRNQIRFSLEGISQIKFAFVTVEATSKVNGPFGKI